ncbi:AAA family ATPase [Fusobacterium necrophorum]|uniref:AAA family ATPase n=1 Tax=Fusobacterium necrophorum TaxID=859 RepID=UPI0009BE0EDC|nr:AAA family ATPase [Fusobacterium necrophorum]MDK4494120.1 ATP-binding protein [Fusobacterium necrophorum]
MIKLPENILKVPNTTPTSFLIWGESMSGKTYLAREFDSPIIINTDGNGEKVDTPSISVKSFSEFAEVIDALKNQEHTFKTVIIDLIDDIEVMLTSHICEQEQVEALADIKWGKGYAKQSSVWKKLMMELTQMDMNVIFISHCVEKSDDNQNMQIVPALSQKGLNACMGRCDLSIQTKKIGSNYIRLCTAKREAYKEEEIKDEKVLKIMKTIRGVFDKKPSIVTPVKASLKKEDPKPKEEATPDKPTLEEPTKVEIPSEEVKQVTTENDGKSEEPVKKTGIRKLLKPIKKIENKGE